VKLLVNNQIVETTALVDSGATGNFLDLGLLSLANFPLQRLPKPIQAYNVDGSTNRKGTILWKTKIPVLPFQENNGLELMIVSLGRRQIILGMPWLKAQNPHIDWKANTLSLPASPRTEDHITPQRYLLRWLGLDIDQELSRLHARRYSPGDVAPLSECLPQATEHINNTTTKEVVIPDWCKDFEDVFSERTHDRLPPHRSYDHTIELKDSFVPKVAKVYALNPTEREACKAFVDEHLKTGRIIPSKSPQAAPFFFVSKKDGGLRPCQDYRYLNSHTVRNAYPLPLIPELIDDMKDSTLFTKFDVRWGYNNVRIKEEDQWKGAFITPFGLFEPTVMFFGFCNGPPTFQTFMNSIFADMIAERWLKIYIDDLGIHTKGDLTLHHERTRRVLLRLREHGLALKLSKSIFDAPRMDFLGMIIGQGKIEMDPSKLTAIRDWKPPASVKGIRSFLGFANFYRKFIPNFSNVVAPLNLLTRKEQPWLWTPLQQRAFDSLKTTFSSAPVLSIPDTTRPFSIMTDASLLAAGAILLQEDTNTDLHPCAYFSKTFIAAERNYDIYDRELLAVILALTEWKQYLQGTTHPVTIITDHKNLSYIKDPRKLSRRQARWALFLQDFDIVWKVLPGTKMAPADALSRRDYVDTSLDNVDTAIVPSPAIINALDLSLVRYIHSSSASDPLVLRAIQNLSQETPLFPRSALADWTFDNGNLYYKHRLYVPPSARSQILHSIHSSPLSGHLGRFRTKAIVERDFWWPGLSTFVTSFVTGCAVCQQNKVRTHPVTPPLNPIKSTTTLPFKQLSVDLVTDLPLSAGHDSLMVVVDHGLTKGVILVPCSKTIDANGIAQLFFEFVFKRFGLHDTLISDRGPQFASAFARELARILHYDVRLSTAYHPQTDGQTERANQEIETYLRIFCANKPHDWSKFLTSAEFVHNSVPHSSTKTSPFSLILGYEPRAYPSLGKTFIPALEGRLSSLETARKEALAAHESARRIMIERSSRKFSPWKVGNKVWLEATNLRIPYPSRKLAPKRHGPFEIAQVLSPLVYRLRLPPTWKIHDVFHAHLLSSYRQTDAHGPSFLKPPPDVIDNEEEYEVDHIVSHKGSPGRRLYLTAWKGYPSSENTWEPESNLRHAPLILKRYKNTRNL
jgi:hypothetical protein